MCTDKMQEMDLKLKEGRSTLAHPDVGVERETQRERERETWIQREVFVARSQAVQRFEAWGKEQSRGDEC